MSTLEASEATVSPRTEDEPMAFTRDELTAGGLCVWVTYVILLLVALTVTMIVASFTAFDRTTFPQSLLALPLVLFMAGFFGGCISFVVMLIGLPLAWLIGRGLQREPLIGIHLLAYTVLGTVVATTAFLLLSATAWGTFLAPASFLGLIIAMPAVVAVPLGWWRNLRRIRRTENPPPPPPAKPRRIDPDAAYEDSL
ncbi:hypothetical protein ASD65_02510 [Microbacterium sp. Root61]|uniref:hypothetical protein n=1 Tax=Microbacterium sp. Root61 TaxID=1736570 RepID=UPI000700C718|nr:hypothetical protein [Microbacterium sp. Root61]KRA23413.1 hypothetical protein ASD65_02510 [Microbacterium sp. Root61]